MMTLHDAILDVLEAHGGPLTFEEIASRVKQRGTYFRKKDGQPAQGSQIRRRVLRLPHLFEIDGKLVSKRGAVVRQVSSAAPRTTPATLAIPQQDLVKLTELSFISVARYEDDVPALPGVYAIQVADTSVLPPLFAQVLADRGHRLLYIGQASISLESRLGNELRARGAGTFFRSLGAILGYVPRAGSLIDCANQDNFRFEPDDRRSIVAWLNRHVEVAWAVEMGDLDELERGLIADHRPLLNLKDNPSALPEVVEARDRCKAIARVRV